MSASHKPILRSEIPKFCCFIFSIGLPTLWDGQPHACRLLRVVTFESPCILDHSIVGFELLFSFPFITYHPRVTRTVFAILWHEILPSRRSMNSDQCLFPFPLPIIFIFLTKSLGFSRGANMRNVIVDFLFQMLGTCTS